MKPSPKPGMPVIDRSLRDADERAMSKRDYFEWIHYHGGGPGVAAQCVRCDGTLRPVFPMRFDALVAEVKAFDAVHRSCRQVVAK